MRLRLLPLLLLAWAPLCTTLAPPSLSPLAGPMPALHHLHRYVTLGGSRSTTSRAAVGASKKPKAATGLVLPVAFRLDVANLGVRELPKSCEWLPGQPEPQCVGPALHELVLHAASGLPAVPSGDALTQLGQAVKGAVDAALDSPQWAAPVWQSVNICVQLPPNCTHALHTWMWNNLALMTMQVYQRVPTQEHHTLAMAMARWAVEVQPASSSYERLLALHGSQATSDTQDAPTLLAQFLTKQAIARGGASSSLLANLGNQYHNSQQWELSRDSFHAAFLLDPTNSNAASNLLYLKRRCAEWNDMDVLLRTAVTSVHTAVAAFTAGKQPSTEAHPWIMLYYPVAMTVKRLAAEMHVASQRMVSHQQMPQLAGMEAAVAAEAEALLALPPAAWRGRGSTRLRVGLVSADFRLKATAYLCAYLFKEIDRSQIELFVYSTFPDNPKKSAWRLVMEQGAEHFVELAGLTELQAVQRIREDAVHVLVDMDGFSNEGQRLPSIFVSRLAPVQMAYFVYIGTVGSPTVDYIITDRVASPPSSSIGHTEKFLYLPTSFFPNNHAVHFPAPSYGSRGQNSVALRTQLGLPQDAFVLTCFNKHMKIMPELWAVWMRVMHRAPNAVLWLLRFPKDSEGNLKAAAAAAGVDPTRLVFSDFVMTSDENFERLHAADLVLDTTVYGAHTGAADALWAGKPLLTCIGPKCATVVDSQPSPPGTHSSYVAADCMTSRIAASMLVGSGLEQHLVTRSLLEYEERAVLLATNTTAFAAVKKATLGARRADKDLWDVKRYATRLVRGFRLAWEAWLSGSEHRGHIYSL